MKANIKKGCIGCGLCTDICPSVFQMTKKLYAEVYNEVSDQDINDAKEAVQNCPVSIISLED